MYCLAKCIKLGSVSWSTCLTENDQYFPLINFAGRDLLLLGRLFNQSDPNHQLHEFRAG